MELSDHEEAVLKALDGSIHTVAEVAWIAELPIYSVSSTLQRLRKFNYVTFHRIGGRFSLAPYGKIAIRGPRACPECGTELSPKSPVTKVYCGMRCAQRASARRKRRGAGENAVAEEVA